MTKLLVAIKGFVPYGQCLGLQVWPTSDQVEE